MSLYGPSGLLSKGCRTPATPMSSSRRLAPPSSTSSRSTSRPGTGTSSVLRGNNNNDNVNRQLQLNLKDYDPVEVYCRIKPLEEESDSCIQILDDTNLALIPPDTSLAVKNGNAKENHYAFQRVFGSDATQKRIFDEVALPLVKDFLQGKNALLFAYGVTGSGKTFTMSGNSTDSGVMPRCLDVIFNSISKNRASKFVFKPDRLNGFEAQSKADAMLDRQKEMHEKQKENGKTPRRNGRAPVTEYGLDQYLNRVRDETTVPIGNEDSAYAVFITYVEVYNNSVYDLLDESPIDPKNRGGALQTKMLREDINRNVYVNQVTEVEVESPEDAFGVYLRGQRRRRMAHTALNTESSRSHSIFNIRLVQAPLDAEGEEVVEGNKYINVSQLSLVDLAGSERHGRTQASGERLKEAGNINNSLMTLRKCMQILRENQKNGCDRVVAYRESKLTHFLKNYFDGEGRVRMILCVNPKSADYDENLHVMTFAELTQEIQIVRPQEKKLDPMTPHRLKANEMYKEAKRQLVDEKIIEEDQLPNSDVKMVFGMGIPIPMCKMSKSTEEECLATLRKALEIRVKAKGELASFIAEKRQSFRLRLAGIDREMVTLRSENERLKSHIQTLNAEINSVKKVYQRELSAKQELEEKYKNQEQQILGLEEQLHETNMQLRQQNLMHHKEKENLKGDMDLQRELDARKLERDRALERARINAEAKLKDKTIEAVRELVNGIESSAGRARSLRSRTSRSTGQLELSTTSSESDIPAAAASVKSDVLSPRSVKSRFMSTPVLHNTIHVNPPSTGRRNALVSNPRYGRARSTDRDVWLEHTDRSVVFKSQTVFQPVMKKKRSVNKLNTAADVKGATNYCLYTQEADSDGDIQTKLYKGEINPTITGGANMVLKDVESLKQLSPTGSPSRKRRSSVSPGPGAHYSRRSRIGLGDEPDVLSLNTIGDRCRQGIGSVETRSSRHSRKNDD